MKKFILLVLLINFFSCQIPQKEILDTYENGKIRTIGYYILNNNKKVYRKIVKYYSNGLKEEITHYDQNGNLDGKNIAWYPNGQKRWIITYKKNIKHGAYIVYYKNGKKQLKGYYKNGLANGKWIFYDQNGNKISSITYNNGKPIKE